MNEFNNITIIELLQNKLPEIQYQDNPSVCSVDHKCKSSSLSERLSSVAVVLQIFIMWARVQYDRWNAEAAKAAAEEEKEKENGEDGQSSDKAGETAEAESGSEKKKDQEEVNDEKKREDGGSNYNNEDNE